VAVLAADAIHVIVDDVPVGGMPEQTYMDRRQASPPLPLDAFVGAAVKGCDKTPVELYISAGFRGFVTAC
jgi:hypothetical protein